MTHSDERERVPLERSPFPRYLYWIAGLFIAVGFGWIVTRLPSNDVSSDSVATRPGVPVAEKSAIYLYFGDPQSPFLRAEQLVVARPADDADFGRLLLEALIKGPRQGGSRTLPDGARLRTFFVSGSRAYADFESDAFIRHPGGVEAELLTIYAIVNTLVVNVEAIREVQILIGGQNRLTLAGHVELRLPFMADMTWVR